MSEFDRPTTVEEGSRRSRSSRFADLGDRLARTFSPQHDPPKDEPPVWDPPDDLDYGADTVAWEPGNDRFPVVHHGYDPVAVDEEIAALEQELGELRAHRITSSSVQEEIDKIGQQTASILRTAYEQAHEITRSARVQADKCVADAAANAVSITEDANRRLRELDGEADSVWQERNRLIEDARSVATELFSLAESAAERFVEDPKATTNSRAAVRPPQPVTPLPPDVEADQMYTGEPFDYDQPGHESSSSEN